MLTKEAKIEREVKRRIKLADGFYQKVRKLLWNEEFPMKCKLLLFKVYFIPILTYGVVSWTMSWKEKSLIQGAEMKFVRSMLGVTKMDKIKSKELRKKINIESLNYKLGKDRLKWYGKLKKMDNERIPKKIFDTEYEKRRVGRPRKRWIEQIKDDIEERGEEWEKINIEKWWEEKKIWEKLLKRKENIILDKKKNKKKQKQKQKRKTKNEKQKTKNKKQKTKRKRKQILISNRNRRQSPVQQLCNFIVHYRNLDPFVCFFFWMKYN
jgi:hypothetical protein